MKRAVLVVGRAEIAQPCVRLARDAPHELSDQARFAEARLPRKQYHPPVAGFRLPPAPQQELELFVAPDERRHLRAQCLEAAQDAAFADDPPHALPFCKPGEWLRPEILDLEQSADLPTRAFGNDERTRLGESLEPCGKVWRLANDAALLRSTRADQVADDDQPAGNPEPDVQWLLRRQPADGVDDGKSGAHRPLGIV